MTQPLAEIFRPKSMSDIVGQSHLIGENKPLTLLSQNKPQSIILWGPPGVGKTTIANILINSWNCQSIKFSAVLSGVKEIRDALDIANSIQDSLFSQPLVLFVDEIHRFNKAQQDAFLHHLEEGKLILIGATTENPSFALNNALLSRVSVYVLNPLTEEDLNLIFDKVLKKLDQKLIFSANAKAAVINMADGDARKLINIFEYLIQLKLTNIDESNLKQVLPSSLRRFDKGGEDFYNQISALHKSVRGSNPNASLYWFMRMLGAGAEPLYLGRRLLRMAWEDIGLSDTNAANVVVNALSTYERLGSPEGELALASAVIYLATAPKSNSVELAFNRVKQFVSTDQSREVPYHLRNAPTKLMAELGYGREYRYAHDYPHHYVPNENYWPDNLAVQSFYTPTENGDEAEITAYLKFLQELDYQG